MIRSAILLFFSVFVLVIQVVAYARVQARSLHVKRTFSSSPLVRRVFEELPAADHARYWIAHEKLQMQGNEARRMKEYREKLLGSLGQNKQYLMLEDPEHIKQWREHYEGKAKEASENYKHYQKHYHKQTTNAEKQALINAEAKRKAFEQAQLGRPLMRSIQQPKKAKMSTPETEKGRDRLASLRSRDRNTRTVKPEAALTGHEDRESQRSPKEQERGKLYSEERVEQQEPAEMKRSPQALAEGYQPREVQTKDVHHRKKQEELEAGHSERGPVNQPLFEPPARLTSEEIRKRQREGRATMSLSIQPEVKPETARTEQTPTESSPSKPLRQMIPEERRKQQKHILEDLTLIQKGFPELKRKQSMSTDPPVWRLTGSDSEDTISGSEGRGRGNK